MMMKRSMRMVVMFKMRAMRTMLMKEKEKGAGTAAPRPMTGRNFQFWVGEKVLVGRK